MNLTKEKGKNAGNFRLLIVLVIGYLFFLTSKLWLPDMKELIDATPYYEIKTFDNYSVYLTKWEYAENQKSMEIVVEIETKDLLDSKLSCEAKERTHGALKTDIVLNDREFLVIRITDIPKSWKEISLHLTNEDGDYLSLYTNSDAVKRVEKIEEKDAVGYEIDRIQAQIEYDDYRILQKQDEISRLTAENQELKTGIEEMKAKKYPTQEEADNAALLIAKAEEKCASNERTVEDRKHEIEELEGRSEELKKQLDELIK